MRKRFLKRATALAMATAMAAGSATTAFAGQWKQDATGYWWDENGSYPKNEWKWLDGYVDITRDQESYIPVDFLCDSIHTID